MSIIGNSITNQISRLPDYRVYGHVTQIIGLLIEIGGVERGRFPAINVTKSISRSMPKCNTDEENELVIRARRLMATYEDMEELIRLGAYRRGSDKTIDESIHYYPMIEDFLRQKIEERTGLQEGYNMLSEILGVPVTDEEQILDEEPADQQIQTGDEQQTEPNTEQ